MAALVAHPKLSRLRVDLCECESFLLRAWRCLRAAWLCLKAAWPCLKAALPLIVSTNKSVVHTLIGILFSGSQVLLSGGESSRAFLGHGQRGRGGRDGARSSSTGSRSGGRRQRHEDAADGNGAEQTGQIQGRTEDEQIEVMGNLDYFMEMINSLNP